MKLFNKKQSGVTAIMALIYIVLFAMLGGYMLTLSTTSSLSASQSLGSMRAWFAAKSSVEWAAYQADNRPACTCGVNCCTVAPAIGGVAINFTEGGLDNFQSTMACAETPITEAATDYCVYDLSIRARRGVPGNLIYVSRSVNVSITDAP